MHIEEKIEPRMEKKDKPFILTRKEKSATRTFIRHKKHDLLISRPTF